VYCINTIQVANSKKTLGSQAVYIFICMHLLYTVGGAGGLLSDIS
jgi:hypothetical protein